MKNIINSIVTESHLPNKIQQESLKEGLRKIDFLLDDSTGPNYSLNAEFLSQVKADAEKVLVSGYNFAKTSVIIPAGLWGLSNGFSSPDLDITTLGIGNHRFFLFHSALGLVVLRMFYKNWLYSQSDPDKFFSRVSRKISGVALGSFAMGVSLHLAVDVFQPKSIVFPFFGSLINGTLVDDNIWLLGNSLWAFQIGREIFSLSIANELSSAKAYVLDRFVPLRNNEKFNFDFI